MAVRVSTLANGLRVISDELSTVETASVGVWVGVGTRHEPARLNGISHLLEHMAFKGTTSRSAYRIAEEIENVGGHLNAYTSRELTAYYAKILKEDLGLALDIIADILQNSTFEAEELAREQAVVVQEISQALDTPDDIIFDHFQATAYPDQPMGRPVLGTAEIVRGLTSDDLRGYLASNYTASNMVLSAAGRVNHEDLVARAQAVFGGLATSAPPAQEKARYAGGDFREDKDLEQVQLVLGFDGVTYDDPDFYAASVLASVLGGGMSSRLFQEVREKRGLVYSIYAYSSSYDDGGLFGVYAGTGAEEVRTLMPVVCDEISKLADGISADEVARSKAQFKAGLLMSLESTSSRCEQIARQLMIYGRPQTTEEIIAEIEAVSERDLIRVAERLLKSAPTFAALGPLTGVEDYPGLSRRLAG